MTTLETTHDCTMITSGSGERDKNSCLTHLYFSIILLASSRLSSVEVVPPGPPPPFELSSLFIDINAKYMSPIIDCNKKKNVFVTNTNLWCPRGYSAATNTVMFIEHSPFSGYYFSSFQFQGISDPKTKLLGLHCKRIHCTCCSLISCQRCVLKSSVKSSIVEPIPK